MAIEPKYSGDLLFNFRHVIVNSAIWVNARGVAEMLEYSNPTGACKDNVKQKYRKYLHQLIDTSQLARNEGNSVYIAECGLYNWLAVSKQEKAQPFQDYLYEDLLPKLRKEIFNQQAILTSELQLHTKVVSFIRKFYPDALLVAPLGELQDTSEKRILAWQCGYRAGLPDLVLCSHHKEFSGMAMEFKNCYGTGKLSEKQKDTLDAYRKANYMVLVSNNYEDILVSIIGYLIHTRVCCGFCKKKFKSKTSLRSHELNFHKIQNA